MYKHEPAVIKKQSLKLLKLLIPHVALLVLLLVYLTSGAAFFRHLEATEEWRLIGEKIEKLRTIYENVVRESFEECRGDLEQYGEWLTGQLNQIADVHLNSYAPVNPADIVTENRGQESSLQTEPRWSFAASILYAFGIMTTTGYSYVQVNTNTTKILSIVYGLIGLPLLFITAADIGKFLSEIVFALHKRFKLLGCKKRCSGKSVPNHKKSVTMAREAAETEEAEEGVDSQLTTEDVSEEESTLPPTFILSCTFIVALFGATMYTLLEGWTFVESVYYTFLAITNVSLVDVPCSGMRFAVVTVAYVIIALAVVTMSLDLADSHIRVLFKNIHYFGRHMKGLTDRFKMDEEAKALMNIIAAIRMKNPNKSAITQEDIASFMQEQIQAAALSPINSSSLKQSRSCSLPYTPDYLPALQFADGNDEEEPEPGQGIDPNGQNGAVFVEMASERDKTPELDVIIFKTENHTYQVRGGHVEQIA